MRQFVEQNAEYNAGFKTRKRNEETANEKKRTEETKVREGVLERVVGSSRRH